MTRVLIISHVPWDTSYGAGTSLRLHLKVLEQDILNNKLSVSLITRVGLLGYIRGLKSKASCISNINNLGKCIFALDQNYDYDQFNDDFIGNIRLKISIFINRIFELVFIVKIIFACKKQNFNVIHLNSHVLISIAAKLHFFLGNKRPKFVVHIRDFLNDDINPSQKKYFMLMDSFVCIDYATQNKLIRVLGNSYLQKSTIIQNPFTVSIDNIRFDFKKYNISNNKKIYAIVGAIIPEKGVVRVCKAFLAAELSNSIMVVVGNGSDVKELESICSSSNGKVIYLGEIKSLVDTGFYKAINFLVRGDSTFRTGRTVFEALYESKIVILPGNKKDLDADSNLAKFKNKIVFYEPFSIDSLINIFKNISLNFTNIEINDDLELKNNFPEYREKILNIYD